MSVRRWASLALKIGLTVGSLWLVARRVDLNQTWQEAISMPLSAIIEALLLQVVQILICGLRWQFVLRALGTTLSYLRSCVIFTISNFFGQVLPGAVGSDVVRVFIAHKEGVPTAARAFNSVMLERVATVFGLVLTVAALEPVLAHKIPDLQGLWVFPTLTIVLIVGTGFVMLLDRHPTWLAKWRIVRGLAVLAADTRRLFLSPAKAIPTVAIVIVGHLNLALIAYVLARGLGVEISLLDCVALFLPAVLIATLPISISGWGPREAAIVTLFGMIGMPAEKALALSVLFAVVGIVVSLPGGLLWLLERDRAGLPKGDLTGDANTNSGTGAGS